MSNHQTVRAIKSKYKSASNNYNSRTFTKPTPKQTKKPINKPQTAKQPQKQLFTNPKIEDLLHKTHKPKTTKKYRNIMI